MERGGKTRGRGRPRKTLNEMVNQPDDDSIPYLLKTTGRKRGRPRKTPQKTVNETDDDYNSFFPKITGRKRGRPRKTPQKPVIETDEDDYNSSFPKELSTNGPSHPVQDSGVAFKHPLHTDLLTCVRGKNGSSGHLATPIDEKMNLLETEDNLCCPTKGKTVAAEPASESILQENNTLEKDEFWKKVNFDGEGAPRGADNAKNKGMLVSSYVMQVSGCLDENIAKNLVSSNSSKSECGSSIFRSKRSKDFHQPIIPMDSCEDDDHLTQTQVNVVANDATKSTCQSFDLTEVADKIHNTLHDNDDEDDIQSSIDPSLVDVKGYRVRPEIAPLLHQILEQHDDIAKDCKVKALRGCFLEKVCSFYEKLQKSSFQEIKRGELYEMGETLDELEHMGLNVKWLSDRLYDILDVKVFLKVFAQKSKEFKKGNNHLITLEKTAASIRRKMSVLETEITRMKGEEEKIQKMRNLLNSSLVDGLI